jgi:hypothetical protein
MIEYLLPCEACGKKTAVSSAQAGDVMRCTCGAELTVPTLRQLKQLEIVESNAPTRSASRRGVGWEDRHRLSFLLAVVALAAWCLAGYLAFAVPPAAIPPSDGELVSAVESANAKDLLDLYRRFEAENIGPPPVAFEAYVHYRKLFKIGIVLSTAVGAAAAAGAIISGYLRRQRSPAVRK